MPLPIAWHQIKQTGNLPNPRSGHSIVTIGKTHYLFGGLEKPEKYNDPKDLLPKNQLYALRIVNNQTVEWTHKQCSGDLPFGRAFHSACKVQEDKMFIFGGCYTSNERYNDCFYLKLPAFQWHQPPNQKSQGPPKNAMSKIGGPQPRAYHSMTYYKNKIIIFGGHGGVDYQRTSFNDLYELDLDTYEWRKPKTKGNPPEPRGGHLASLLAQKDKLLIFGGWNFVSQFNNIFVYDFETETWNDPQISHEISKWNMNGILAPSIPSWKYFVFGGSSGNFFQGSNRTGTKYENSVYYLDVDYMNWVTVKLQEEGEIKPLPRESAGTFYNADEQKLYVFGGWASEWLNDMWMLPVGSITGPPYAIESIKPKVGPLTGKTKLSIYGAGFKETYGQITVRFFGGKSPIDTVGVFKDENMIECETPPFDQPKKCQIRVSCGKYDMTITSADFTYFLNTKADQTIAFGPGLLQGNHVDGEAMFYIQARNAEGQNRTTGADDFSVKIKRLDIQVPQEEELDDKKRKIFDALPEEQKKAIFDKKEAERKAIEDKIYIPAKIIDHEDGTYLVKYKAPEECKCEVEIKFVEEGKELAIRGAKYTTSFENKGNPKMTNDFDGTLTLGFITSQLSEISRFLDSSKENIDTRNKDITAKVDDLLKVMTSLKSLDERRDDIYLTLDRLEETLKTFERRYDKKKDGEMKKVMKLMEENKTITFVAAKIEKEINGPKTLQAGKTKEKIKKFEEYLKLMQLDLKRKEFYFYDTGVEGSFAKIEEYKKSIQIEKKKLSEFVYYEEMFKFPESETNGCQKIIDTIEVEVGWMFKLWQHIKKCQDRFDDYLKLKWSEMDLGEMEDQIKKMRTQLNPIKVQDRKCNTFLGISEDIKRWSIFIPLINDMKHDSMNTPDGRHWKKIKDTLKQEFSVDDKLQLKLLWYLRLFDYKDTIEETCEIAKNQAKMDKEINAIIQFWKVVEFELVPLKNSDVCTLKMIDDNFQTLENHQLSINTMLLSKFVAFFEKLFEQWKQDLGSVYDVIQLLSEVQKTWSFLENLFIHSEEVKKELPEISKQFVGIDVSMREIMKKGGQVKNILKFCTIDGMYKRLDKIEGQLKVCEKALNQYLDSKRKAFPRFYFVSVLDLLDILSNGNSPMKINKHSPKIFQAIEVFKMQESGQRPTVTGLKAGVGQENVTLVEPLKLMGKVETYLQDMIDAIVSTLSQITTKSFSNHANTPRNDWIKQDPAQITLLVNNTMSSSAIEECFRKISDGSNVNALKDRFKQSVELLTGLIKMVQGELTKEERQKIMCLITLDTQARDIVDKLDRQNVKKADAFQWQSQLKFYWTDNPAKGKKDCQIRIADASFWYSYQYLGNGPRLVVTPLTDRIYVTATQALHLKMGCAPAGPAGTGKTETTKDLSFALAKAIYVFNCSGQMNYESMGNIYKGLASSGCWGCFDQFNRLLPEVLSVCSVQFKSVTDAIKQGRKRFILQGDQISLDPTCGVFITMNPGYLGRAELPEGLKALFRPITVVVPDLQLICENMLMAEGFVDAKVLAKKFVTLYFLCRDLLSKQLHYDWGLRAIKSVLVVAGVFKRNETTVSETALLMRALRDFNLPKIAYADLDIFFGLLGDLFPKIEIERKRQMNFENIINEVAIEATLHPHESFILKIVQLKELLQIRHCVFVMGPPGAGKTQTWKQLGRAQDRVGKKTIIVDINPKTISTKDLYGYNLPSKEWKDGLLSKTLRSLGEIPDQNPKWLLLDGDLDTNWIESMNSVMDDNKILTLANNERIPLKGHMRMIFEIRDLRFASPATVSRAGILYISDDSGYQWQSYIASWLDKLPRNEAIPNAKQKASDLRIMLNKYMKSTLFYIKKSCKLLVPVAPISMVASICKILDIILKDQYSNIEYIIVFALIWCCGGSLAQKENIDYRKEFSNWWKSQWKTTAKFPSKGTVFDYYVLNPRSSEGAIEPCKYAEWTDILENVDFDSSRGDIMSNISVPTKESVATEFFIKKFIFVNHPVMLIGLAGCGKTAVAKGCLRSIVKDHPNDFNYQLINFSYYTDSTYLQVQLEQFLKKIAGKQFGPPGKQKLIYFIDDLNMPQLDIYDTQSAIALLRQHADYDHWYDVGKLALKDIVNTQILTAMNPSAGSFFVNPRYMRHFWIASIPFPDNESLFLIYSTFLQGHLKRFKPTLQELAPLIIRSALTLHQNVMSSFRKTALNFHYEFNLRHLSGIFQGLLFSDPLKFQEPDKFVKLWVHESERTYGDRLISPEHLAKYNNLMFDLIKKSFAKYSLNRFFSNTPQNLIFCNFTTGMNGMDRLYDLMPNDKLLTFIDEGLTTYNDSNAVMNLVLFEDAMKHVCRITRIVTPSSGHALLVGVGGSGKQSLSRLSASMNYMTVFQITISSSYGINDLKTDLQTLYQKTGVKEDDYLFMFTEGQITNERFLVYLNDLLASGEIAQLYTSDEKEEIINAIRSKVKSEGKIDSRDNTNCWNWYIDKVKQKLHMALCFSPVGESLRRRARQFPALVNSTVIDWFFPWPKDALTNVATRFLQEEELGDENQRNAIIKFMPTSFESVNKLSAKLFEVERRHVYTTPKSFLELIKLFKSMLQQKRDNLLKEKERYQSGLFKLRETAEQVAIIEEEVKVKQIQAEIKKAEADVFAAKVKIEKEKVEIQNEKAEVEEGKCSVIKKDVEEKKAYTETRLEAAGPLVIQAEEALNSIQKKDFQIAKSFAQPPGGVPEVFAATQWLLAGYYKEIDADKAKRPKSTEWKSSIKLMKDPQLFINTLLSFKEVVNQNEVPAYNMTFVKKEYLSNPEFDPAIIANKSKAAAGLCSWVVNIVKFWDVIQEVGPLRKQLEQAKQQLAVATVRLNQVQEIVRKLNSELALLNKQFQQAEDDKQRAINEAERCARRLNLAQRLIAALGSENERWAQSIVVLDGNIKVIVGDVLLASAFISYAGPFNKPFRLKMMKDDFEKYFKTNKIETSPTNDPIKLLTDESIVAKWNKQSLPSDKVSVENGTILTNSERYPLMIDPQLQGISWIREKQKDNKLKSLRLGSKNINRELQIAIQLGYSAMIENMGENIDAILMPCIARSFIKKGRNKILKFAGKDLTLHANFKLFLQTKLSNPHYPPQIQAEATLINFTVTEDGLGDQLLYLIVKRERPDLAAKKLQLITQQNDFKIKLKDLQDQLLFKLANAKGDILDDIALIQNLEYSKKIAIDISEKVEIAKVTEAKINQTSQLYRPAASRGALIYFLLSDLPKIYSFYKYSLQSFIDVINRAIDQITEGLESKQNMFDIDADGKAIIPETKKRRKTKKRTKVEAEPEPEPEPIPEVKPEGAPAQGAPAQGAPAQGSPAQGAPAQGAPAQGAPAQGAPAEVAKPEPVQKKKQEEEKKQEDEEPQAVELKEGQDEQMSAEELKERIVQLIDSISHVSFHFTRRGLLERHKLIVSSMLTFRIMQRAGDLKQNQIEHLILNKADLNPSSLPEPLKGFLNEAIWANIKGLEVIPVFNNLGSSLQSEYLVWKKWYSQERVEELGELPKSYKEISKFYKLLLYRAMRPDRVASALSNFVGEIMGERYVEQPAFNIFQTFSETTNKIPIFFVLFPGVDPTPEVERVAAKYDISTSNKKFTNISMGQGQEKPAKEALFNAAEKGHWVLLQNLHLMQTWLKGINGLEGMLETVFANSHPNFRVMLSSEPPPLPEMEIIPESILQTSVKVANEAPQFLKANLRRAYANFDQNFLDKCEKKPNEFKACLFTLCYFHSLVVGRKKFGSQGWSRIYSFNDGDLTICADVLHNYLSKYDVVPWEDLKYIFGEIMYGGHITDNWDRRTNAAYLKVLFKPELLLPNFNLLYHLFKSPDPAKLDYQGYRKYIEEKLPGQVPQMFGMHPNAEIGYLTLQCETLFDTILSIEGGSGAGAGGNEEQTLAIISDFKTRAPEGYSMLDLQLKIKDPKDKTPFVVVCLQECERMNTLLDEIKRSLEDLRLGLTGALNITDTMENLQRSLSYNKVPASWEKEAYPSRKNLAMWFNELIDRCTQLDKWSAELQNPYSLCISYLFNPMSFLTAIMQITSREKILPLDNMSLQTNITLMKTSEEVQAYPESGAYIHGLVLEGAAWEHGAPGQEGYLIEQRPKELHPRVPVVNVISVITKNKKVLGQYDCPVYYTTLRGATFIFNANLNMESEDSDPSKWVLSGTCLLLSDD